MNIQLSKNEQLIGLLTGIWSPEADLAFRNSSHRDLMTVKRADILDYLRRNPETSLAYLKRWEAIRPAVDINAVWSEGDGYKVAWLPRDGKPWAVQEFRDMNEAIAEHVCRHNGIQE